MSTEVELPNGVVLEMPDGVTPEEIQRAARNFMAQNPEATKGESWTGLGKAGASGVATGAVGSTAGLPRDMADMAGAAKAWAAQLPRKVTDAIGITEPKSVMEPPAKEEPSQFANMLSMAGNVTNPLKAAAKLTPGTSQLANDLGINYTPQTEKEKWVKAGATGVGGMAVPFGGMTTAERAAWGAATGLGGEAGARFMGGDSGPGRFAGSAAAPMLMAALATRLPGASKMVQGYLGRQPDESPFRVSRGEAAVDAAARQAQGTAGRLGTGVTLSQGMEGKNALSKMAAALAEQPEGSALARVLGPQPAALEGQLRSLAEQMTTADAGAGTTMARAARAAETGERATTSERSGAAGPYYEAAARDHFTPTAVLNLATHVDDVIHRFGLTNLGEAQRPIARFVQDLIDRGQAGFGLSAKELNGLAREWRDGAANMTPGSQVREAQLEVARILRDAAERSPNIARGSNLHRLFSEQSVEPMAFGGLPGIAGAQSAEAAITALNRGSAADVRNVAARMNAADRGSFTQLGQGSFPALVKAEMLKLVDTAKVQGGRDSASWMDKVINEFYGATGASATRAKFNAKMEGIADAHGMTGQERSDFLRTATQLFEDAKVVARDRVQSGINKGDFLGAAGNNPVAEALKYNVTRPLAWLGKGLEMVSPGPGVDFKQIADILADPRRSRELIDIANTSRKGRVAEIGMGAALDVNAVNQPPAKKKSERK